LINQPHLAEALVTTSTAIEKTIKVLLTPSNPAALKLWEAMRYATLSGGKRLRPFLVMQTAQLFNVSNEQALRTAAAVEMVHAYSLAHDDLPAMDDDDLRRGQPTVHKKFNEGTAILAGDALQTLAFEVLANSETHPSPEVRCSLISGLANASGANGMAGGQMLDLNAASNQWTENSIYQLQLMKTAALFSFSCESGAILGQATIEQRQLLKEFGTNLGIAFQITDDMLDVTGDVNEVGKAVGKDSKQGKATLVSIKGIDKSLATAANFCHNAIALLNLYDDKADILCELVRHIIKRRV
jgi:farnesyl diphosphate synthase